MHPFLAQSAEAIKASETIQAIDSEHRLSLIVSAARTIFEMHKQLGAAIMPANDPQPGNIVYDLAELATLLDQGIPGDIVASGLREAGVIMARLCELLSYSC